MKKKAKAVPRFSQTVHCPSDVSQMTAKVVLFLKKQRYFPNNRKGEAGIYKKGTGFFAARKYIKICPQGGGILVEAFVDVYGTESGLDDGFTVSIPKNSCRKVVEQIVDIIQKG
jgi:hypothetical protein